MDQSTNPQEERRYPRVRLIAEVASTSSGAVSQGQTENVSVGGLLVLSPDTFDRETPVTVRFSLPSGHRVEAQGLVVHSVPGVLMGIQFLEMKEDDQAAIAALIQPAPT